MRRLSINLAAAVSAILLLIAVAAWVWSEIGYQEFVHSRWDAAERRLTHKWLYLDGGCVTLRRMYFVAEEETDSSVLRSMPVGLQRYSAPRRTDKRGRWEYITQRLQRDDEAPAGSGWDSWIRAPLWWIALPTAVLPALWLRRYVRRRRFEGFGCCPRCGYDLRGSPARCPECGAVRQPPHNQPVHRRAGTGAVE